MIGIDWVAVALLGGAYLLSTVKSVPRRVSNAVMALACFAIAAFRLYQGATGINLLFVLIAGAFGVQYAVRAFKSK